MKDIVFVIGPANSGKSTYIKKHYPDYFIIDLFNFQQQPFTNIYTSYEECCNALKEALETHDKVVLEHTLLKKMRRPQYLDVAKQYGPVHVVALNPSLETLCNHSMSRFGKDHKYLAEDSLSIYELPEEGDGFDKITIVGDEELNG